MAQAKSPTESPSRLPLLLGLAVVLAGIALWDWSVARNTGGESAEAVKRPSVAVPGTDKASIGDLGGADAAPAATEGAHPLARLSLDELHDTVKRPLFEKTRRPVDPPPVRTTAVPMPPSVVPRSQADPNALTLQGVLMGEERGGAIALLRRNQTGQNVRLQEGDTVDGWTVERIEPERVFLKQGDTKIALQLFRKR